jgi:pimeloyl-ACP methyl ester carboxylesterase
VRVIAAPLQRAADAALYAVAPNAAARAATDAFSRTRDVPGVRDDLLPLGARPFSVPGQARVARGYLWGSGGAVAVLLHGWRSDSGSMFSLVEPVLGQGFTVAAFDAPGHGSSEGEIATMREYALAAEAVLSALGDVRVVIAHSLGAIAAVASLARTGAPVAGLVFIAPTCTLSGVLERWRPANIKLTRERVDDIYRELHRRNGTPLSHWDVRSLGRGLTCPVLAIHDPDDPVVPFGDSEAIAAALPQTRLLAVRGRGHDAILMAPEVKEAVARFVAGLRRMG